MRDLDTKRREAQASKERRDKLAEQGLCINGSHHGIGQPRCEWCRLVHRVGVRQAMAQAQRDQQAVQPPPGYKPSSRGMR